MTTMTTPHTRSVGSDRNQSTPLNSHRHCTARLSVLTMIQAPTLLTTQHYYTFTSLLNIHLNLRTVAVYLLLQLLAPLSFASHYALNRTLLHFFLSLMDLNNIATSHSSSHCLDSTLTSNTALLCHFLVGKDTAINHCN